MKVQKYVILLLFSRVKKLLIDLEKHNYYVFHPRVDGNGKHSEPEMDLGGP